MYKGYFMKVCFKCKKRLPLAAFYKHKDMKDGRLNKCKECNKVDSLRYREKNIDKVREYDRRRGYRGTHNKETNTARKVKVKNECHFCFDSKNIEKHHPDYNKPLWVVPLCRTCHRKLHAIINIDDLSPYTDNGTKQETVLGGYDDK